jgi:hypothetical protein
MKPIANFFSYVIHPLFIPMYSIMVMLVAVPERFHMYTEKTVKLSMIVLFLMTCFFPSIIYLMMRSLNIIGDLDIRDKKQRLLPYLVAIFFYLTAFLTFRPRNGSLYLQDPMIASFLLGATISLAISFFLNNFIKVSLHSNGVGGFFIICIMIAGYSIKPVYYFVLLSILMMGIIGFSRVVLEAHSPKEVYLGLASGIIGQSLAIFFYLH